MKNEIHIAENGLPDVAQSQSGKKIVIVIMICVILVASLSMYLHSKSDKGDNKAIEESYTVEQDVGVVHKSEVPNSPKVGGATTTTPEANHVIDQAQVFLIQEKQKELQQRLSAPLMVVNFALSTTSSNAIAKVHGEVRDANSQFMNQVSAQGTQAVAAVSIAPLNSVIAEGSLIHAILEPAADSDLPGSLRAIVSQPSYSEDGTQTLIPRGSRLIGQYKSGMMQGQARIFIVWTRLITPEGLSASLGSPGIDSLGVSGMGADEIDRHFWERFGTASLLSLIGAGAANVGVNSNDQQNSTSAYKTAIASSFSQAANQVLQQDSAIAPTLKASQGKPIMVFVARDINFQAPMKSINHKSNANKLLSLYHL